MKSILLAVLATAVVAHADMMKPATLDIVCTGIKKTDSIRIVSNAQGSAVAVNGVKIMQGEQLIGGTEGGGPYLQSVGGGYNITVSGGDFEKAFNTSSTIVGKSAVNVQDFNSNKSANGICKGTFSF